MGLNKRNTLLGVLAGSAATGVAALTAAHLVARSDRTHHAGAATGDPTSLAEPPDTVHRVIVTSDGGEIHVLERGPIRSDGAGAGTATIVLLHGVTLGAELWNGQLADLGERYRVIALDWRGHGTSRAGSRGFTLAALAEDLADVIERLELTDVVIVGHSMGGMALMHALRRGRLAPVLRGIVFTGSAASIDGHDPRRRFVINAGRRLVGKRPNLIEKLGWLPPGDLGYLLTRGTFGAAPSPVWIELCERLARAMAPGSYGAFMTEILRHDERSTLAGVDVPTLVLVGSRDEAIQE